MGRSLCDVTYKCVSVWVFVYIQLNRWIDPCLCTVYLYLYLDVSHLATTLKASKKVYLDSQDYAIKNFDIAFVYAVHCKQWWFKIYYCHHEIKSIHVNFQLINNQPSFSLILGPWPRLRSSLRTAYLYTCWYNTHGATSFLSTLLFMLRSGFDYRSWYMCRLFLVVFLSFLFLFSFFLLF